MLRERIGGAIGELWAPAIAALSKLRHARMFHPEGLTFAGDITPVDSALPGIGRKLSGRVLARLSGALWRHRERFDVLGIGLRIRPGLGPALDETPAPGDQDLLFATIRSPLTMLASPLFTNAHDFVTNRYWAVAPFAWEGERVELRLTPIEPPQLPGPRESRLLAAVHAHRAAWWLEARRTLTLRWHKVARIELARRVIIDQSALQFDPFRTGLGLEPVGLVHAIRRAAYAAGQAARPH